MAKDNREKRRYWAFIYYPESPIKDYKTYLQEHGATRIISPWHDEDINELTGEQKKKHKHIILVYDGPQTRKAVETLIEPFNSPIPIPQVSIRGAVRYLTHANNPEKKQYRIEDIELVGLKSIEEVIDLSAEEVAVIWRWIKETCTNENITEYSILVDYTLDHGFIQEFNYCINHTLPVNAYLTSKRFLKTCK